jgi:Ras-related protein Rab-5C
MTSTTQPSPSTTTTTTTTTPSITNNMDSPRRRTKIVLLGETNTGKTSIATRFAQNTFAPRTESTIGAAFLSQTCRIPGRSESIKFEIWDTAGEERYASIAPLYYRGAAAAIVVYDVTSKSSFERAQDWIVELQKECPGIVIALAGNKCDLFSKREVSEDEVKEYSKEVGVIFLETSAKTDFCVGTLFEQVAIALLKSTSSSTTTTTSSVHINDNNSSIPLGQRLLLSNNGDDDSSSCGC